MPPEKRQWDEVSFLEELTKRAGADAVHAAHSILEWATHAKFVSVNWGGGQKDGVFTCAVNSSLKTCYIFTVWTRGAGAVVVIYFTRCKTKPPFDDESKRLQLLERLNGVEGVDLPPDAIDRLPSIPLSVLAPEHRMTQFLKVLDWIVKEIRASPAGNAQAFAPTGIQTSTN